MTEVTRFAPSPSGRLHLGHAYAALFAREAAGKNGRFLLRIEDIDGTRCRSELEQGLYEDLAWLGLDWERPVLRQSERGRAYQDALERLKKLGVLYPCFCTRREIAAEIARAGQAPHGPEGALYPGTCRVSAAISPAQNNCGPASAWRLDVEKARKIGGKLTWHDEFRGTVEAQPEKLGDVVLARRDIATSYHLAVTLDDAAQGVSLVTRGADLFEATHIHRLLQALLELPVPRWKHHELLKDSAGKRLAKRDRARSIAALREAGWTPQQVRVEAGIGASL
ncbi:MAG: tRNA glutamyl-Q(34) synthetase GluQRS [Kiloniellales bacterium]